MERTTTSTDGRPRRRPSRTARRANDLLGAGINLALIWLINVAPGWRAVPVLTEAFTAVVGWMSLSLLVGCAVNLLYVATDPTWMRRLGDATTAAFGCVVLALLWTVFPFDLGAWWSGWTTLLRVVLAVATIGTGIAVVANLAQLAAGTTDDG